MSAPQLQAASARAAFSASLVPPTLAMRNILRSASELRPTLGRLDLVLRVLVLAIQEQWHRAVAQVARRLPRIGQVRLVILEQLAHQRPHLLRRLERIERQPAD